MPAAGTSVHAACSIRRLPSFERQRVRPLGRAVGGGCTQRSDREARLFLAGLASRGVRLHVERVDSAWVARVVSPHRDAAAAATPLGSDRWPRGGGGGLDAPPLDVTLVTEGAVLFVRGEFR